MRIESGAPNEQRDHVHPALNYLAAVRAAEVARTPVTDPLAPSLRPQTLVELGALFHGDNAELADFVTDQVLAAARMCVEKDKTDTLLPRDIDRLTQAELARAWIIRQPGIAPPSFDFEARRQKIWTPQVQGYFDRSQTYALRQMVDQAAPPLASFLQSYPQAGALKALTSSTVGAAAINTGLSTGSVSVPLSEGVAASGVRGERGADNWELGTIRESLHRTNAQRGKRASWIGANSLALDDHIKATSLFADIMDHIMTLERSSRDQRPSGEALRGLVQHARSLILQSDAAPDMRTLQDAVSGLREVCDRLSAIIEACKQR